MNALHIIGNLVRDPETRTTTSGSTVCSFTVAVNRRRANPDGSHDADFFRVSAWNKLGENCQKYLAKGRKVCVVGSVTAHAYSQQDGKPAASLEVMANEVEFLSARGEGDTGTDESGFTPVDVDDLPFGGN